MYNSDAVSFMDTVCVAQHVHIDSIHELLYLIFRGISGTEIRCDSTAYPYDSSLLPSTDSVVVHIGNANVTGAGVEFTFRRNPTFTRVNPPMTIAV